MSPAEHYLEAGRLLDEAAAVREEMGLNRITKALVAEAQVHALLATATAAHSARPGRWEEEK